MDQYSMHEIGKRLNEFTNIYFREYESETGKKEIVFEEGDNMDFLFMLLDKTVENLGSIAELMKLTENKRLKYVRNSIYILLRSSLSDSIIICWLLAQAKEETNMNQDEIFNNNVTALKKDHIKYHLAYLRKMDGLGLLPKNEKQDEINILNSVYKQLLGEEINDTLKMSIPNSTQVKDMLHENNKYIPAIVEAYKCYYLFSKVEHPGVFTKTILEKTHQAENSLDNYFYNSINVVVSTVKSLAPLFFKREEFKKQITEFKLHND